MAHTSVDEWLDEIENYGTRRERLISDLSLHADPIPWLRSAWELGAAAEREACAKVADALRHDGSYTMYQDYDHGYEDGVCEVATRIRARQA